MSASVKTQSSDLFERATRVIPGGIYGHVAPSFGLPGVFPYYAERAEGCRYWDVDGAEFIDFMCGYGPVILGYQHAELEDAVQRQRARGDCLNQPAPVMVELAEKLVSLVDFADWAVFGKNGSDMTSWAVQVARESTRRKKVLMVRDAYHGWHGWCTPGHGGLIQEDQQHVHLFDWNNLDQFQDLLGKHRDQVAAVICTPFHHPAFRDLEMPAPGFFEGIQAACRRDGVVFILDDVRAGFRLHLGGSHRYFGFEPDLICFSKALGNGYPISAALGRDKLKQAASRVFLTGSFWNQAVPMAAALKCLEILERDQTKAIGHIQRMGTRLMNGLRNLSAKHGLSVKCSGPSSIPFMTFENETNLFRSQVFCSEAVQGGVFFHPHHNWFLSAAHHEDDIDAALEIAGRAFGVVREKFGS